MRVEVPLVDFTPAHADLAEAVLADFAAIIAAGSFTNGSQVAEFESRFAAYTGAAECVGTSSGLDALRIGLLALGIGPGHEVVLPANTFVATAEAVTQTGAAPILVDASEADYNIDAAAVEEALSRGPVRAVVPVHLYGQLADLAALRELAAKADVALVEDACQAHGAARDGIRAGSAGAAAAFSFYPAKNLGAMGDAGALVTSRPDVAATARALREHGQVARYEHAVEGWTARLDTLQAAVLLRKLERLDRWNDDRRRIAGLYLEALAGVGDLVLPPVVEPGGHVWHLFVVRTGDPARLAGFLGRRGIETGRHYPVPVHLAPAYAKLGHRPGEFPVAEALARTCVSLPLFPGISDAQVERVVIGVKEYFSRAR